jgi:hypothetical protein
MAEGKPRRGDIYIARGVSPGDEGEEKEMKAAERRQILDRCDKGSRRITGLSPLWGSLTLASPCPGAHAPG